MVLKQVKFRFEIQFQDGSKVGTMFTEEDISSNVYTAQSPDPDLIVRTGGNVRVSNFLLWQSAYSEFWFTRTLWPDFKKKELLEILECYKNTERRFGGLV